MINNSFKLENAEFTRLCSARHTESACTFDTCLDLLKNQLYFIDIQRIGMHYIILILIDE